MRTFSAATPLSEVVEGCEDARPVSAISELREEGGPTWARILMACEREQFELLNHLWSPFFPSDEETTSVWFEVVKRGFFLSFLNPADLNQRRLFQLLAACFANGRTVQVMQADSHFRSGRRR